MRRKYNSLTLESVAPGSPADGLGLRPGDCLCAVNDRPVRDLIDFQFLSADPVLRCGFRRPDRDVEVRIPHDAFEAFGVRFEAMRFCACGNHCVFCFTDQNPKGLRKALYFKDEDYRLSFLYGNYVTLTAVDEADLVRIADQRLSPLFISIHATDEPVRRRLLGIRRDDRLLEKIRFLAGRGIEMHGQVVLCPGINDGEVLGRTVDTLAPFFPRLRSLAVVPLGLTKHRKGLPRLRPVDAAAASAVLRFVRRTQKRFLAAMGERFLYASDEFYLLAGASIPPASHYGDFWQSDNGVGMVRAFLSDFRRSRRSFPKSLERPARFVVATGTLAGPVLRRHVLPVLNRIGRARFVLAVIPNRFFGESVTVSGLLAGRDVAAVLGRIRGSYTALLPSNCLNADGLFLDDWTLDRLSAATGRPVRALDSFSDALRNA